MPKQRRNQEGRSRKSSCKSCCRCARVYRMEGRQASPQKGGYCWEALPGTSIQTVGQLHLQQGGGGILSRPKWRGVYFSHHFIVEITDWETPLREFGLRGSVSVGELYGWDLETGSQRLGKGLFSFLNDRFTGQTYCRTLAPCTGHGLNDVVTQHKAHLLKVPPPWVLPLSHTVSQI